VSSAGLLERWSFTGQLARNALGDRSAAQKVVVNLPAILPASPPATVGELVTWIGTNLANIALPPADVTDLCTAVGVPAASAASTLTTNASKLALTVGLVLCHPRFQRR